MSVNPKNLNHPQVSIEGIPIPAPPQNVSRPAKGSRPDGNAGTAGPLPPATAASETEFAPRGPSGRPEG